MSTPKTLSLLFAKAGKRIEKEQSAFICEAIEACKSFPSEMRGQAKEIIKERLGGHIYYTEWVREKHPDAFNRSWLQGTLIGDKRRGRIAWCLALAEEFKEAA